MITLSGILYFTLLYFSLFLPSHHSLICINCIIFYLNRRDLIFLYVAHLTDVHFVDTVTHHLHQSDTASVSMKLDNLMILKRRVILKLPVYLNLSSVIVSYVNESNSCNYRTKNPRYASFVYLISIQLVITLRSTYFSIIESNTYHFLPCVYINWSLSSTGQSNTCLAIFGDPQSM